MYEHFIYEHLMIVGLIMLLRACGTIALQGRGDFFLPIKQANTSYAKYTPYN
eukprot:SAG31_NODE_3369_length_4354_cov_4.327380_2_plen_52_part_00